MASLEERAKRHQLNPTDAKIRGAFYASCCEYILQNPNVHFLEAFPDLVQVVGIYAIPEQIAVIEKAKGQIESQMGSCTKCIALYYRACTRCIKFYKSVYPQTVDKLEKALSDRNLNRHRYLLVKLNQEMRSLQTNEELLQLSRHLLHEMLMYPYTLVNQDVCNYFIQVVELVQKGEAVKMEGFIYPGILLLACHFHAGIALWARKCLKESKGKIGKENAVVFSPVLNALFNLIRTALMLPRSPSEYDAMSFNKDTSQVWIVLELIVDLVDKDLFASYFTNVIPDADKVAVKSIETNNLEKPFHFLDLLLQKCECPWLRTGVMTSQERADFINKVLLSPEFKTYVSGQPTKKDYFRWISKFCDLSIIAKEDEWISYLISEMVKVYHGWSAQARAQLKELVLYLKAKDWPLASKIPEWDEKLPVDRIIKETLMPDAKRMVDFVALDKHFSGISEEHWQTLKVQTSQEAESVLLVFVALAPFGSLAVSSTTRQYNTSLLCATESLVMFLDAIVTVGARPILLLPLLCFHDSAVSRKVSKCLCEMVGKTSLPEALVLLFETMHVQFIDMVFALLKAYKNFQPSVTKRLPKVTRNLENIRNLLHILTVLTSILCTASDQFAKIKLEFWTQTSVFIGVVMEYCKAWSFNAMYEESVIQVLISRAMSLYALLLKNKATMIDALPPSKAKEYHQAVLEDCINNYTPFTKSGDPKVKRDAFNLIITVLSQTANYGAVLGLEFEKRLEDCSKFCPADLLLTFKKQLHAFKPQLTQRNNFYKLPQSLDKEAFRQSLLKDLPQLATIMSNLNVPAVTQMIHQVENVMPMRPSHVSAIPVASAYVQPKKPNSSDAARKLAAIKQDMAASRVNVPITVDQRLNKDRQRQYASIIPADPRTSVTVKPREETDNNPRQIKVLDALKPPNRPGIPIRMPSNPSAESKSLSLRNLTDTILDWDMETPQTPIPPNFSPRVAKYIPDSFKTGEEYCETMEPLLVLECWEQFLQARAQPPKLSYKLQFERLEMVDQSHELIFAADSKETKGNGWTENTILLLSLEKVRIMGRILSMTMKPDKCKIVLEVQLKGLRSKYAASLRPQTAWVAREIYSLTTVVREYNSLINFKQVTLKREILNPEVNPPPFSDMEQLRRESQRLSKLSVNEPQACAITAAVYYKSGFVLINGPPGSGKTRTIIGMIGALKSTGQSRILICAPSNAAIDEIGQRLLSGIQDINGDIFQPKVVRVGSGSTHDSIKKITLDNLLEAAFNSDPVFTSSESLKRSKTGIDGKLKSLHDQRTSLRILASASDSTSLELQQQLQQLSQEIHNLKDQRDKLASSQSNLDFDTAKKQLRQRILGNADIVLATLSASGQDIVSQMGNVKFPLVIIDEACQSVEVSSLIPLRCGARKVILVGDPNQLPPTVMSQVSKSKKYDQSLFARIAQKTPKSVMLLSIQYRMHPELSIFPSKHFYNSRLQDAPGMAEKRRAKWHEKFKPYQCIHVPGEEKTGGMQSYYNMMEVDIIVGLVKRLADAFPLVDFSQKIGIITFYSSQLSKLKSRFQQEFGPRILQSIDINTVDGFQGQEKEIVFLSTVRTKSIGFTGDVRRINVSLTRAMSTLVIVGNVEALRKDPTWYKLIEDAERRKLLISLKPNQLPFISQTTFNNLYSKETPIEDENRKRKRTNE